MSGIFKRQRQTFINFTANACNSFNVTMTFQGTVIVDWGDGTSTSITNASSAASTFNKTYSSAFTGLVRIGGQYKNVTNFQNYVGLGISTTAKELGKFTGLLSLDIRNHLAISGLIIDLPRVTIQLLLLSLPNLTITGTASDLPRVTTVLFLDTLPNFVLTGNVIGLSRVTTSLQLNSLPNLNLTGTALDLPRVTITLSLVGLANLTLTGTVLDLPRVTNTLTFNVIPNLNLTGTALDLPRVTNQLILLNASNLTLTGTAIDLPLATDVVIQSTGLTITNPANGVLKTVKSRTLINQTTQLLTADTDRYLNDSALYSTTWNAPRIITLSSLGRTSASDAAVTTLNGRGVTINLL